jgi:hypothetical protein
MRGRGWGKFTRELRMDRKRTSGRNISFPCKLNYPCDMFRAQVQPRVCNSVIYFRRTGKKKKEILYRLMNISFSRYLSVFCTMGPSAQAAELQNKTKFQQQDLLFI